jgi:hypothetical protein
MDNNRQQITEILAKLRHNANTLVSTVVLETQSKLKEQSPVDTGRFRANWLISEDELDDTTYPDGQEAPPYGLEITADKTYYITNSLPYAQRLAEGWSRQSPAGWVELIAEQIARALDGNS